MSTFGLLEKNIYNKTVNNIKRLSLLIKVVKVF